MEQINELSEEELSRISTEFQRIKDCVYLDHTGATLYSEKQIDAVTEALKGNLFCNPHTNQTTEDLIDSARYKILKFFNTNISEYDIVFTSGATSSLKIIAECFDFNENGRFFYIQENHTSVLGMREIVKTKRIHVLTREEFLKNSNNDTTIKKCISKSTKENNLLVFSAQCNFSGFKYPLKLIKKIQKNGLITYGHDIYENSTTKNSTTNEFYNNGEEKKEEGSYYICLDAASYVGTNYLDLKKYTPDFVTISFYKMFGYPTGLGALLVSNRGQKLLNKNYYGGGTVKIAMSLQPFHNKRDLFHERFEDGTLSFLTIPSILSGISTIEKLIVSKNKLNTMQRISNYVFELAQYCYNSLKTLKYNNLKPLVKIYSHTNYTTVNTQGGVVTFNLLYEDGSYVGFGEVACLASIYNIYLRTGCFCNPGACQVLLELNNTDLRKHYQAGHICGDYNDLIDGVPTGAVRVSFGYMSRKEDIDAFLNMIKECYLKNTNKKFEIIKNSSIPRSLENYKMKILKKKSKIHLREICIYPIKSCGPFKIKTKWELNENGFKYDRCWMIINSSGVVVTQKINSKLCLITPIIDENHNLMKLTFPDFKSIEINLENKNGKNISSSLCQSKICGDLIEGIDCGDDVAKWLCDVLNMQGLRLIQQCNDIERKNRSGKIKNLNLSNQAQFLLINFTSVAWLTSKIDDWLDCSNNDLENIVDRFRGNLIIETKEPLEENKFTKIKFGEIECKIDGPCNRCQMICIDQNSGLKTAEPLRTITKEFQGKMRFGIYLSQSQQQDQKEIQQKSSSEANNYDNLKKRFISCDDEIIVESLINTT